MPFLLRFLYPSDGRRVLEVLKLPYHGCVDAIRRLYRNNESLYRVLSHVNPIRLVLDKKVCGTKHESILS